MGKLMKYEWKKQRTSRMIVMVALAVCVLTFLGGVMVEKGHSSVYPFPPERQSM